MTRWIRGRLGRPIASILFGLMLVSFFLPLAPPRAQAQIANISKLFGEVKQTTPIAVVDFDNRSRVSHRNAGAHICRRHLHGVDAHRDV